MTTSGEGSPSIYSTGNITVTGAVLKATGSEAAVIEGKNSITLNNVVLSGAKKRGVMLYQSFSGDAEGGTSVFKMTGGSLTDEEGPLFYATNTAAVIELMQANRVFFWRPEQIIGVSRGRTGLRSPSRRMNRPLPVI